MNARTGFCVLVLALLSILICVIAKRKVQGKVSYELNFSESWRACEDEDEGEGMFGYQDIIVKKESPTSTSLGGSLTLHQPMKDGTQLHYSAFKLTDTGKVPSWTLELLNLCQYVGQTDMPWAPLLDEMKLDRRACPIPAKTYPLNGLRLNTSSLKTNLNKGRVGEYELMAIMDRLDGIPPKETRLTCFIVGYKIEEIRLAADED